MFNFYCNLLVILLQNLHLFRTFVKNPNKKNKLLMHEKLRVIRKQKGISQEKIAKVLCTDVSNYSRKERGEIRIQKEEWQKIAKMLGVSVEDIQDTPEKNNMFRSANLNIQEFSENMTSHYNILLSTLSNLQDYISFLKDDRERLKIENINLHEQIEKLQQ